jgi:hypothetical protein
LRSVQIEASTQPPVSVSCLVPPRRDTGDT